MNKFHSNSIINSLIYSCSLKFNTKTLQKIIDEIYEIENENKYSSDSSRTFKLSKGFHSVNLLDKKYGILEKYHHVNILVSRIQELVFNHFKTDDINFQDCRGSLHITEIWINILRNGDYNIPHNHPNCDISGNFYLNCLDPTKKIHDSDGSLLFIKSDNFNYVLPGNIIQETSSPQINPKENLGILFRSYKRHIVMPHFTDEDRIGVAFNSKYVPNYSYDDIYPTPYWLPIKYDFIIKKECINNNNLEINFKNTLSVNFPIDNIENKIGQKITLTPKNMKNIIDTYSIDKNSYFNL